MPEQRSSIRELHELEQLEARMVEMARDHARASRRIMLVAILVGLLVVSFGAVLFWEIRSASRQHETIAAACVAEELNLFRGLLLAVKLPAPTDVHELVAIMDHGRLVPMPDPAHAVLISLDRLSEQQLSMIRWDGSRFVPINGPTLSELHSSRQLDRVSADVALLLIHINNLANLSLIQESK